MQTQGKMLFTMGEVAEMFDVNQSLIRFWEQRFDILKPQKNKKGNRLFTPKDIENLKIIYHLVKERGMTLEGARRRLAENREGIERDAEIIERLEAVKALLMEVKNELREVSRYEQVESVTTSDVESENPIQAVEPIDEEQVVTVDFTGIEIEPQPMLEVEAEQIDENPESIIDFSKIQEAKINNSLIEIDGWEKHSPAKEDKQKFKIESPTLF